MRDRGPLSFAWSYATFFDTDGPVEGYTRVTRATSQRFLELMMISASALAAVDVGGEPHRTRTGGNEPFTASASASSWPAGSLTQRQEEPPPPPPFPVVVAGQKGRVGRGRPEERVVGPRHLSMPMPAATGGAAETIAVCRYGWVSGLGLLSCCCNATARYQPTTASLGSVQACTRLRCVGRWVSRERVFT